MLFCVQCDMPEREGIAATPSQLDEYCANNGFAAWYECSAKDNLNIEEAHRGLIAEVCHLPTHYCPTVRVPLD